MLRTSPPVRMVIYLDSILRSRHIEKGGVQRQSKEQKYIGQINLTLP